MRKDTRIVKRTYKNVTSVLDTPVEPKQAMSVIDLFAAMVAGYDIPEKMSNGYDEDITIDDVGYAVQDTLDATDYLKAVNQRIAQTAATERAAEASATITETSVTENVTE